MGLAPYGAGGAPPGPARARAGGRGPRPGAGERGGQLVVVLDLLNIQEVMGLIINPYIHMEEEEVLLVQREKE